MTITDPSVTQTKLAGLYKPLIGGQEVSATSETFPAIDASTGAHLADISRGGKEDIDAAVEAAERAFKTWSRTSLEERSALLLRLADRIENEIKRLSVIDAMDIGRRVGETEIDHRIAIGQYRYFAAAALTHTGWNRPIEGGIAIATREPIGVVGQIIPWNVPAIMAAFKLAPALAAGNTVVLKPDENASLSTLELGKIISEIFPPGVVNIVPGFGEEAGASLTAHPGVKKLAFTGSSEVGRLVAAAGANRLVPVSLELGGKSPNIVFPDVGDKIDAVVDNAAFAVTYCNGQSCLAGTRLFVHDDIYDTFMTKLAAGFERIRVGGPLDPNTVISGLVSEEQGTRVMNYIDIGKNEAELVHGGRRLEIEGNEHGWFVEPTIFATDNRSRIAQEEIFGPVLSVIRWNDHDQMIHEANDVRYGLAAGVYTNNIANAMRTARELKSGSVWVNKYFNLVDGSPFGGVKDSGIGSEFCSETLNMYSHLKSITLLDEPAPAFFLPQS
ncbi:aldehyde dehydrogenase family protein [Rhodococcus sp. NPDC055024]